MRLETLMMVIAASAVTFLISLGAFA